MAGKHDGYEHCEDTLWLEGARGTLDCSVEGRAGRPRTCHGIGVFLVPLTLVGLLLYLAAKLTGHPL